jgi:4-hydroxybenzoate polyprenyltransferase
MDKLSGMRMSGPWARAVLACVDEVPAGTVRRRRRWVLGMVLVGVGLVVCLGVFVWVRWVGGLGLFIH